MQAWGDGNSTGLDGRGLEGCGLEVCECGAGAGKISQIPARRGGFKFCGCGVGADKKFQPA